MASIIIVEDGTGLADANSYVTLQEANDYFTVYGQPAWEALDELAREQCLVKATQYIDVRWGELIDGARLEVDQALVFPRTEVSWIQPLPRQLKVATYEYALRAIEGDLLPDLEQDASGYAIQRRAEQLGPMKEEITFAIAQGTSVPQRQIYKIYPLPDSLMAMFLKKLEWRGVIR